MAEQPAIPMEEITDPAELARAPEQDERQRRNQEWLEGHWSSLLPHARGKFVAVARQEAFIAATAAEAWVWVESAYPDDDRAIVRYVRPTSGPRIYAGRWHLCDDCVPRPLLRANVGAQGRGGRGSPH